MKERKAEMKAMNDQLRQKVRQMNAAEGQAKISATAEVANDLAAQHLKVFDMMTSMSEQRMGHMLGHTGDAAAMQQCPVMKSMAADAKANTTRQAERHH